MKLENGLAKGEVQDGSSAIGTTVFPDP